MQQSLASSSSSLVSSLVRWAVVGLYPLVTYAPQFRDVSGFSSGTCLIGVLLSVVKAAAWIVHPVEVCELVASVALLVSHLVLLDAIARKRRRQKTRQTRGPKNSAQFGSHAKKLLRAWLGGRRDTAWDLWRKLRKSFWLWDDLAPYVEVVVLFSLLVLCVSLVAVRSFSRASYGRALGFIVAVLDASLSVPQLVENRRRGSTGALSFRLVAFWLLRDLARVYDRRHEKKNNAATTLLVLVRLGCDLAVMAQVFLFSPTSASTGDRGGGDPERGDDRGNDDDDEAAASLIPLATTGKKHKSHGWLARVVERALGVRSRPRHYVQHDISLVHDDKDDDVERVDKKKPPRIFSPKKHKKKNSTLGSPAVKVKGAQDDVDAEAPTTTTTTTTTRKNSPSLQGGPTPNPAATNGAPATSER